MAAFLSNNLGTILTGIGLLMIVTAVIFNIYWDKKKNGCSGWNRDCSCCHGCSNDGQRIILWKKLN